jgi:hypothetical protein
MDICKQKKQKWPVQRPSGTKYSSALTCIDPATGWFEMIEVSDKTAESLSWKRFMISGYADIHVLKWYNSTTEANSKQNQSRIRTNVQELWCRIKAEFAQTCRNFGLKAKPTSTYNPQSNGSDFKIDTA